MFGNRIMAVAAVFVAAFWLTGFSPSNKSERRYHSSEEL